MVPHQQPPVDGIENLVALLDPTAGEGLRDGGQAPGGQHEVVHSAGEGDGWVTDSQLPEHGTNGSGGLLEALPSAAEIGGHSHEGHADLGQARVVGRVGLGALLAVGAFFGPFRGHDGGLFQDGGDGGHAFILRGPTARSSGRTPNHLV